MATGQPVVPGRLDAGSKIKVSDGAGGEKDALIGARYEVYDLASDVIAAGIQAGSIISDENTVVKVGDEFVVYTQLFATDLDTMKALNGGPVDLVMDDDGSPKKGAPSVCSDFNYGRDLNAKRAVRQAHEQKTKGPERTINSTVKGLIALGYSQAEAEAIANAKRATA